MTDFRQIETIENAVKWDYFKGVLNWSLDKIAYEMDRHPRRLTEWVNTRAAMITTLLKADKGRVKAIRKKLEKQYPPPLKETKKRQAERKRIESLNPVMVARAYVKDRNLNNLAKKYKIDNGEFKIWWSQNLSEINQHIRKLRNEAQEGHMTL